MSGPRRVVVTILVLLVLICAGGGVAYKLFISNDKSRPKNRSGSNSGGTTAPPTPTPNLFIPDTKPASSFIQKKPIVSPTSIPQDTTDSSTHSNNICSDIFCKVPLPTDDDPIVEAMAHVSKSFIDDCSSNDHSDANKLNCSFKQCYESEEDFYLPKIFLESESISSIMAHIISTDVKPLFRVRKVLGEVELVSVDLRDSFPPVLVYFSNNDDKLKSGELRASIDFMLMKFLTTLKNENIDERLKKITELMSSERMKSIITTIPTKTVILDLEGKVSSAMEELMPTIHFKGQIDHLKTSFELLNEINEDTLKDFLLVLYLYKHGINKKFRDEMEKSLKEKGKCNLPECGLKDMNVPSLWNYCMDLFPARYVRAYITKHKDQIEKKLSIVQDQFINTFKDFLSDWNFPFSHIKKVTTESGAEGWFTDDIQANEIFKLYGEDSLTHVSYPHDDMSPYSALRIYVKHQTWKNSFDNPVEVWHNFHLFFITLGIAISDDKKDELYVAPALLLSLVVVSSDAALSNYTRLYWYILMKADIQPKAPEGHMKCLEKFRKNLNLTEGWDCTTHLHTIHFICFLLFVLIYDVYVCMCVADSNNLVMFSSCFESYLSTLEWIKDKPEVAKELKKKLLVRYASHFRKQISEMNEDDTKNMNVSPSRFVNLLLYHNKMFVEMFECDKEENKGTENLGDRCVEYSK
eukprot:GHVR01181052.1.p1 GENE.GHVR01181052.1~~GHVR01181052.1.p1  ORF type:complete len:693 (-),score=75.12 GHVR01181052.1:534-2612(-)